MGDHILHPTPKMQHSRAPETSPRVSPSGCSSVSSTTSFNELVKVSVSLSSVSDFRKLTEPKEGVTGTQLIGQRHREQPGLATGICSRGQSWG